MEFSKDITLRPRFSIEVEILPEKLLATFEKENNHTDDFIISRSDAHIFIRIPKSKQHFWSPQLHLEIYKIQGQRTTLKGLYGPSPEVWTLFMFLHFIVSITFITACIWMYTNYTLGASYAIPLAVMFVLALCWFALYLGGRLGRKAGENEMKALSYFMNRVTSGHLK